MAKGKRIMITGGAGFIGSNIANALCASNTVMILDNMHSGSVDNVEESKKLGAEFFKGDSGSIASTHFDPDVIFHLGIYSSTPMYRSNHKLVASVVSDAIGVFDFAAERGIPVVFASSSSIYNGHSGLHHEGLVPKVTDYYTEARIAVERLAELYASMSGLDATALRQFSIYGPHDEKKGIFGNLITQFMLSMGRGEQPVIYGDGTQARDFTYVSDVMDAYTMAAKLKGFNLLNVGRGESYTINQMIEKLNEKLGTEIQPKYIQNPLKNYVDRTEADTSKAEKVMGFRAKVNLEEGINKLYDYLLESGQLGTAAVQKNTEDKSGEAR